MQNNKAKVFKALCDEKRIAIIELLGKGEKCACNIIDSLDIAQSALSYHMKILCESGLVEGTVNGKWTHYKLSSMGYENAKNMLNELFSSKIKI